MRGGAAISRVVEPDYTRVHIELRRKGVTLMLSWADYRAAHEGQQTWAYTQFCGHYKDFAKTLKRSMRQQRRAGEKLFIDYAGPTLKLADGSRAQVFVAAMGASSYTFALRNRRPEHALLAGRDGPRLDVLRRRAAVDHAGQPARTLQPGLPLRAQAQPDGARLCTPLRRLDPAGTAVFPVITDFNMPGISGLDVVRALAAIRPDLPVLMPSGHITDDLRSQARAAGVVHMLAKEDTAEQIGAAVATALLEREPTPHGVMD